MKAESILIRFYQFYGYLVTGSVAFYFLFSLLQGQVEYLTVMSQMIVYMIFSYPMIRLILHMIVTWWHYVEGVGESASDKRQSLAGAVKLTILLALPLMSIMIAYLMAK
ncbi:MAG: hypothetical protein OXC40_00675 [Proteobacteria bacterium]|nr:hypothetical protein [Pseudomonadota bacterium]